MKYLIPWNEIEVSASRSSGAGGQHVNKTNSAVVLRFSISNSLVLSDYQKQLLLQKLSSRLTLGGDILVRSEQERDQKSNKETAFKLLNQIIWKALQIPKKRVATKPTRSSKAKRVENKKHRGEIKALRNKSQYS